MRKEDFFEVLGELEDDIVKAAKAPVKKRINRKVWGMAAACFVLVCFFAVRFFPSGDGDETSGIAACYPAPGDLAPMVYVNDMLYIQSTDQQGYPEWKDEFVYLGKIESTVSEDGAPHENFQANDPIVGCEVYQYGENIVVCIHDAYWLYTKYEETEIDWDNLTEQEKREIDPYYME